MQFNVNDMSNHNLDILVVANSLLNSKLVNQLSRILGSDRRQSFGKWLFIDGASLDAQALMRLLEVDMEWLLGFISRQTNNSSFSGSLLTKHLPDGWAFAMIQEDLFNESPMEQGNCPCFHIYITEGAV